MDFHAAGRGKPEAPLSIGEKELNRAVIRQIARNAKSAAREGKASCAGKQRPEQTRVRQQTSDKG